MDVQVDLYTLVMAFSRMLDRVIPELAGHHQRVGYFADKLATALNMDARQRTDLVFAALLHDVGALPTRVSADDLIFERDHEGHAKAGAKLLSNCPPLQHLARIVRFHHTQWASIEQDDEAQLLGSIINLADRMDVFVRSVPDKNKRFDRLACHFRTAQGKVFAEKHVAAMLQILRDPDVKAHMADPNLSFALQGHTPVWLNSMNVRHFSRFIGHVIDYRSPFTATHSAGVADTACALARLDGMDEADMDIMYMAGMLHDIGKLDIPLSILEKPGPLTLDEASIMRSHAELGEKWLSAIPGFATIARWGTLHHERLNGGGYPHGYKEHQLCRPSRIMAVADVFTAVTEDRPYREGMSLAKALEVLDAMARVHLDAELVALARQNGPQLDEARRAAQKEAHDLYNLCQTTACGS